MAERILGIFSFSSNVIKRTDVCLEHLFFFCFNSFYFISFHFLQFYEKKNYSLCVQPQKCANYELPMAIERHFKKYNSISFCLVFGKKKKKRKIVPNEQPKWCKGKRWEISRASIWINTSSNNDKSNCIWNEIVIKITIQCCSLLSK